MEKTQHFFDNRIKTTLEKKGIDYVRPTKKKLDEFNITLRMYNKYYFNKASIPLDILDKIADWLKIDASEFQKAS